MNQINGNKTQCLEVPVSTVTFPARRETANFLHHRTHLISRGDIAFKNVSNYFTHQQTFKSNPSITYLVIDINFLPCFIVIDIVIAAQ